MITTIHLKEDTWKNNKPKKSTISYHTDDQNRETGNMDGSKRGFHFLFFRWPNKLLWSTKATDRRTSHYPTTQLTSSHLQTRTTEEWLASNNTQVSQKNTKVTPQITTKKYWKNGPSQSTALLKQLDKPWKIATDDHRGAPHILPQNWQHTTLELWPLIRTSSFPASNLSISTN